MIKTERTALISGTEEAVPKYAFENSVLQRRKRQVRQFQICLSTIICFGVIIILVTTTVSLTSQYANLTSTDNETDIVIPTEQLFTLPGILECSNTSKKIYNDTYFNEVINGVGEDLENLWKLEDGMKNLEIDSPSYRHQMTVATTKKSNKLAILGLQEEIGSKKILKDLKHGIICTNNILNGSNFCKNINTSCDAYKKYRSYDGICNNLNQPFDYGVAYKPFRRILPPIYSDGINTPRTSRNGYELPSARTISNIIHRPYYRNDPNFTVMLAVWGQFLDHDITATAASRSKNGNVISCCDNPTNIHPECFPVLISREDPYYGLKNITCMNFVRSAPAPNCCLGPREQMNQVSAYIDGSVIYGSNLDTVRNLRAQNGCLKMFTTSDNRQLLPVSNDSTDGCNRLVQNKLGRYCFASGDARANENLHLTTMHLIWARHHNNLAKQIQIINKHWDDERIFQEVRKILIAQMQHITYNEFLKIIIGRKLMKQFDLLPKRKEYYQKYDENLDASIANSFASSAFRFAHSLIPTLVHFLSNETGSVEYIKLHEILFDPYLLYDRGELDKIVNGAIHMEVQANDAFFTPELKDHLFERRDENKSESKVCGLDLVSLNIQRGRDHGLQGYANWRELCKLSRPKSFDDLKDDIDIETLNYIKSTYRHVEDIDLYTGSLSERSMNGSMLGPTLNCLIIDQFIRLKNGDRHWHENPGVFTLDQLNEIRKTTLAGILCDNSDNITEIRQFVMERKRVDVNDDINCASMKKTNLLMWRENFSHVSVGNQDMAIGYKRAYGTDTKQSATVTTHRMELN